MNILQTPAEYAAILRSCYAQELWGQAAFEAARQHKSVPASYWAAVHLEMLKPQPLAELICRGCDNPPLPGYVNCEACLYERGNN